MKILSAKRYQELQAKAMHFDEVHNRVLALEERISEWENWEYAFGLREYAFAAQRPRDAKGRVRRPQPRKATLPSPDWPNG